ncbi:Major facilitator superfamily [Cryptosporidium felis]|nr:Major facilitator superfamily [Cryptosporidium felis]
MDGTSLLESKGGSDLPEKNSRFHVMVMIVISSWASSCITMIWPLLVVSDHLRPKFHLIMLAVEVLFSFGLGLVSDLKCRKTSIKYSLKIMLSSVLVILLVVSMDSLLEFHFLKFNILRYSGREAKGYSINKESIYDNILLQDESTDVMNSIHKGETEAIPRGNLDLGEFDLEQEDKRGQILRSWKNPEKGPNTGIKYAELGVTLFLFLTCCALQSSSTSLYYNLNIVVVNNAELCSKRGEPNFDFCGWNEICFFNIGKCLSLFLTRVSFISILEFLFKDQSTTNDKWKETNYIYIYSLNLVVLLILIPYGYRIAEDKLFNCPSQSQNLSVNMQDVEDGFSRVINFITDEKHVFWFLLIPYWIIYYVQTSNNFHKWILINDTIHDVEWWELYSLSLESALSLAVSILLSLTSKMVSPVVFQVYCFAVLSMASFGLTLCTYMIHEIPVKSFSDFVSAFTLCHGVFHIFCVIPFANALYTTIKFSPSGVQSTVLAAIHSLLLTAPLVDQSINAQLFKLVSISAKFLIITAIVLFGIVVTGLFMAKQSPGQLHHQNSLELLPVYSSNSLVLGRGSGGF